MLRLVDRYNAWNKLRRLRLSISNDVVAVGYKQLLGGDMSTAETDEEIARQEFIENYIKSLTWSDATDDYLRTLVAGNLRAFWTQVQASNAELRKRYNEARRLAKLAAYAWYRDEYEDGPTVEEQMAQVLEWVSQEELEDEIMST